MSDRGQHILDILPIGGSTQRIQKDCVWRAKVVDDASGRAWMNESITEERVEWRRESNQLCGRQDADSRGCEG